MEEEEEEGVGGGNVALTKTLLTCTTAACNPGEGDCGKDLGVAEDVTSLYCGIKPFCSMEKSRPFT